MTRKMFLVEQSESGRIRLNEVKDHLDRIELDYDYVVSDQTDNPDKKAYYIVDTFEGQLYEKLINSQCAVFGCGAIISSLSLKVNLLSKRISKSYTYGGTASLAMRGLVICFTNIRKVDKFSL